MKTKILLLILSICPVIFCGCSGTGTTTVVGLPGGSGLTSFPTVGGLGSGLSGIFDPPSETASFPTGSGTGTGSNTGQPNGAGNGNLPGGGDSGDDDDIPSGGGSYGDPNFTTYGMISSRKGKKYALGLAGVRWRVG
jgi:hypothetical protein